MTGGSFLHNQTPALRPLDIFEAQCLEALVAFLEGEVRPAIDQIEACEEGLLEKLLRQAGQLGLLGGAIPESYGGIGLSRTLIARFNEEVARACPSFAIPLNVHSGVATLPLLWFGSEAQKSKWLPKLAMGAVIGAFALSEPGAGSDALGLSCRATKTERGWSLSGQKLWITNAGFANVFTVFAKVDGEHVTAFLVERNNPGLTIGRDEKKLGLKGSSTAALFFDNAALPEDAVLGEIGKGHRAALFPLNVGRLNIGAAALGMAREALALAKAHANSRRQFGQPLASFELVADKLARMHEKIGKAEKVVYGTAALLDGFLPLPNPSPKGERLSDETSTTSYSPSLLGEGIEGRGMLAGEEFAIECAIAKIYATEVLDFVVDEALQIHGGVGYSEEFPIARLYRDARIFRIFEGTNEINRLTIADQLRKRLASGRIAPLGPDHPLQAPLAALESDPQSQLKAAALADATMDYFVR